MNDQITMLLEKLPDYLSEHIRLSVAALGMGLVISLPLGVLVSRRPRLAEWTLGLAGVIQTVPSLALLALMVYLLGGMIGFWPAFIALTLYSILPILANTVLGLNGIDPNLIEAGRGLGMTDRQILTRVQFPLGLPVIIGGIRTATVLVVGTATLVTPVGGACLGNYIFSGLESMNFPAVVFGCLLAAALAVVMDQLIRLLEVAARRRSRVLGLLGAGGLALLLLGGITPGAVRWLTEKNTVRIASGPFSEQRVLSELIVGRLRAGAHTPLQREGMSEGIQMLALKYNQVDCLVNYSGNLWTLVMKRSDIIPRERMLPEITAWLREHEGIVCLGSLGFENTYTFVVAPDLAAELRRRTGRELPTIGDLVDLARESKRRGKPFRLGGDNQFFHRPEWSWLRDKYDFGGDLFNSVEMDPTMLCGSLRDGRMEAAVAYSTDGRIPRLKLETLLDPEGGLPPYDAVLLLSPRAARDGELVARLTPLLGAIPEAGMRQANLRVDEQNWSPVAAARELEGRLAAPEAR